MGILLSAGLLYLNNVNAHALALYRVFALLGYYFSGTAIVLLLPYFLGSVVEQFLGSMSALLFHFSDCLTV